MKILSTFHTHEGEDMTAPTVCASSVVPCQINPEKDMYQ